MGDHDEAAGGQGITEGGHHRGGVVLRAQEVKNGDEQDRDGGPEIDQGAYLASPCGPGCGPYWGSGYE